MTHICQFCQTEVPYSKSVDSCDFYICPKCPDDTVIYIYIYINFINNPNPTPMYLGYSLVVNFNEDTYHMDFMANEAFPFVLHKFKKPRAPFQKIMELNYAPDITPDNAASWLEKLLNLKAFS